MSGEAIVDLLGRMFPSFANMPDAARRLRAQGLAGYVAQTWVAGPAGLQQRGIEIPAPVHGALADVAASAKQDPDAALELLAALRAQLQDDPAFARILTAYAKLYASSLQAGRPSSAGAVPGAGSDDEPQPEGSLEDSRADGGPSLASAAAADDDLSLDLDDGDDGGASRIQKPSDQGGIQRPSDQGLVKKSAGGLKTPGAGGSKPAGGGLKPAAASGLKPAGAVTLQPSSSGGGGLDLDLADPAEAPRSAAPVATSGVVVTSSGGDLGGLDLADPDEAPRAVAPAPASGDVVVASSGAGGGGLDLAEEEEEEAVVVPGGAPSLEELLYSAEPEPAPAAEPVPEVSTQTLRERLEGQPARPKPKPLVAAPASAPKDPAAKAVYMFKRTGNADYLGTAIRLLEAQLEQAPHDTAAAAAAAEIGRISILQGDVAGASRYAKIAQSKDPANPMAAEVLVRLGRGEAQKAGFRRQVAEARFWLLERNFAQAKPAVDALREGHDALPHGYLLTAFMAKAQDNEKGFLLNLAEAWRRYPPRELGEVPLGGGLDADLVDMLVNFGRAPFRGNDVEALKQTVENIDHKENHIAGALRMAVGLSKVALMAGGIKASDQRRLTISIGCALCGLQYYDAATAWFGKAAGLNPTEADRKAINAERANAGALRRAFDRPGIKAQLKAYRCLAHELLARHVQKQLEALEADRERYNGQLRQQASRLVAVVQKDPRVAKEIQDAVAQASVTDPLGPVIAAEAELHEVARERALAAADAKNASKSSGLFATLKGAANKVSGAARETKLKFKESQANQKHKAAVKDMVELLTGTLGDLGWNQPALKEFMRRAAVAEAFADYLSSEERKLKAMLERLAALT